QKWLRVVIKQMPHLSKPQAVVLEILLVISVVYRGCGIPVAWKIVSATKKGSWKPYWLELLSNIKDGVEDDWWVIVTTDRGMGCQVVL
ncbi:MAG: hypothetical protein AAFY41_19660, partial [Bacteroidota bacterium]